MADEAPSGDKAVYVFIEMIALGFVLYAIEEAFKENPSWPKVAVAVILGLLFFVLGIKWTKIKATFRATWVVQLDSVTNDYRYRYGAAVFVIGIALFYILSSLHELRHDLDKYAMPRLITSQQSHDIDLFLSQHKAFPVTVKVAVHDNEALQYADQIFTIFKKANWDDTEMKTAETPTTDPPFLLNDGLCIETMGESGQPPDPKHDPAEILKQAFENAHVQVNCGGGSGGGDYKLYICIGHRPLVLGDQEPTLAKFGRWLQKLAYEQ